MPVAVVALAAGSFAAGATAFAAATTLAATVAAGATMVGAALTIVGTVTGNAKLAKIGAIVGIVGGIGTALTSSAGAGAEAAAGAAGDTAASGATDAATSASPAALVAAGDAAQAFPVDVPSSADFTSKAGGMLDAAGGAPNAAAATNAGGMIDAAQPAAGAADPLAQAATSNTSAFDAANTTAGQAPGNAFQSGAPDAFTPASPNNDMALPQSGVSAGPNSVQQMAAWAKSNPELAKMALSAAGGAFGNLVPSPRDKAMMDAYRAQATQTNAQTDALKRKAAWGAGRTTY